MLSLSRRKPFSSIYFKYLPTKLTFSTRTSGCYCRRGTSVQLPTKEDKPFINLLRQTRKTSLTSNYQHVSGTQSTLTWQVDSILKHKSWCETSSTVISRLSSLHQVFPCSNTFLPHLARVFNSLCRISSSVLFCWIILNLQEVDGHLPPSATSLISPSSLQEYRLL